MTNPRIQRHRASIMFALSELSLTSKTGAVEEARRALSHLCGLAEEQTQEQFYPIEGGPAVPWAMLRPHAKQAELNHGQTLDRLAQRGGLSACEALAILADQRYLDRWPRARFGPRPDLAIAAQQLTEAIAAWRKSQIVTDEVRAAVERLRCSIDIMDGAPPFISRQDAKLLCDTLVPES